MQLTMRTLIGVLFHCTTKAHGKKNESVENLNTCLSGSEMKAP
jgi:hypothetical protein